MNEFTFELVGSVPWTDEGLQKEEIYSSKLGLFGEPLVISIFPPTLMLGPNNTLWLTTKDRVVVINENTSDLSELVKADLDHIKGIAPTSTKGVVVLGTKGAETVLAGITDSGNLSWRKVNPVSLKEYSVERIQLISDSNGSIYLFGVENGVGKVMAVNELDGSLSVLVSTGNYAPEKIWVQGKNIFWVEYKDGTNKWIRYNIESSTRHEILAEADLQYFLGMARGPLTNNGALLISPQTRELIWMNTKGTRSKSLLLVGLVRLDKQLITGIRYGDSLCITRWDGKKKENITEPTLFAEAEQQLMHASSIDPAKPVVTPDGSLLLVGADSEGAYVVKVMNN